MARMSLREWKEALGEHVALERVPGALGVPSMQVLRAVNRGRLKLHTFRATDGRVFRAVRVRDLRAWHALSAGAGVGEGAGSMPGDSGRGDASGERPALTMEGMKRAFSEIAGG